MTQRTRPMDILIATAVLATLAIAGATGCQAPPAATAQSSMTAVYAAYNRADYDQAFLQARQIAASADKARAHQAAYMAGLAAYQLGDLPSAQRYLTDASASADRKLAGDSLATLGLVYAQRNMQRQAGATFEKAAALLGGQDKARAYFYAGAAWQKLGHWAQARANFVLARTYSTDALFRRRVAEQLAVTGFTLQLGFYTDRNNALNAAQRIAEKATQQRLGYPVILPATDAAGRNGYLVQVGRFSSHATASMAKSRLGEPSVIIVPVSQR